MFACMLQCVCVCAFVFEGAVVAFISVISLHLTQYMKLEETSGKDLTLFHSFAVHALLKDHKSFDAQVPFLMR